MKGIFRLLYHFVLTLVGVLLIGSLPGLFPDFHHAFNFRGMNYVHTIRMVIHDLFHPNNLTYQIGPHTHSIYPVIENSLSYSLIVLFCGFCVSILLATMLSFGTMILPKSIIRLIKGVLVFLESIPDVFIVLTIQLVEIRIFQLTHVKLFDIISFSHPLYVLPIITLAILPAIMIYRMLILDIEQETAKDYVEFAKSKGLSQTGILLRHIFRNTLVKTLIHARTILFFMISNLLIVEYVYNSGGLLDFLNQLNLTEKNLPDLLTFSILLLMIPMALFLYTCQFLAQKVIKNKIEA